MRWRREKFSGSWPICEKAGTPPPGWAGWPEGKRFAVVLTHDVETAKGQDRVLRLAGLEKELGFRSSFNFVPERYAVSPIVRGVLEEMGFEVGVHGLYHDGKYFSSPEVFRERAVIINRYIREWNVCGFRAPSMLHNLEAFLQLDILYDSSTFDTDPFEPQSDGVETIFPFPVHGPRGTGYWEFPYTLPQDFTLFILLKEMDNEVWKRKLDWIAEKGGMALMNTHPDYMSFGENMPGVEEYPSRIYFEFLEHIEREYSGTYWMALCRDAASNLSKRVDKTASTILGDNLPGTR